MGDGPIALPSCLPRIPLPRIPLPRLRILRLRLPRGQLRHPGLPGDRPIRLEPTEQVALAREDAERRLRDEAESLVNARRYDEAIGALDDVFRLDQDRTRLKRAEFELAAIQTAQGRSDDAYASYLRLVLTADPLRPP